MVPSSSAVYNSSVKISPSALAVRENMRDTSGITIDRETDFGALEFNAEKEIKIKVQNIGSIEQVLKDVRFLNTRSNYELRNASLPVILPTGTDLLVEVYLK